MSMAIKNVMVNWCTGTKLDKNNSWSVKADVDQDFVKLFTSFKNEGCRGDLKVIDHESTQETHLPDSMFSFNFHRSSKKYENPPLIVDKDGNPLLASIGNGSICHIQFAKGKPWPDFPGKDGSTVKGGYSLVLEIIKVMELVVYKSEDGDRVVEKDSTPIKPAFDEAGLI